MTDEHSHTHRLETECDGPDCIKRHHEQYSHIHDDGHAYHTHAPEGAKLVELEDVEPEPEPEPEPKRSHSPLWDGE
jgi:hypothetical protein